VVTSHAGTPFAGAPMPHAKLAPRVREDDEIECIGC
jgi:hypothetical protein